VRAVGRTAVLGPAPPRPRLGSLERFVLTEHPAGDRLVVVERTRDRPVGLDIPEPRALQRPVRRQVEGIWLAEQELQRQRREIEIGGLRGEVAEDALPNDAGAPAEVNPASMSAGASGSLSRSSGIMHARRHCSSGLALARRRDGVVDLEDGARRGRGKSGCARVVAGAQQQQLSVSETAPPRDLRTVVGGRALHRAGRTAPPRVRGWSRRPPRVFATAGRTAPDAGSPARAARRPTPSGAHPT
jgi:hypothetical protein